MRTYQAVLLFYFFCKSIFYNNLEPLNLNAIKNTAWFD